MGKRLSETPEPDRPAAVVVAILTDGLEKAGVLYTADNVRDRIKHRQKVYDWRFVFLAAGQDAFRTAVRLSISAQDAMPFTTSKTGIHTAYAAMSRGVARHRRPPKFP